MRRQSKCLRRKTCETNDTLFGKNNALSTLLNIDDSSGFDNF